MEWIIFEIIILFCVFIFVGIGVWSLVRKTPMHFWSGTTVDSETITDIKKYNRANAIMWFCYCVPLVISMFVAPYSMNKAGIIAGGGIVVGIIFLIVAYGKIKRKYSK